MTPDDFDDEPAIERWMRERPAPAAPAGFTAGVMSRVRQERWKAEQHWDLAFNLALAGGLVLVLMGLLGLVYFSGLSAVAGDAVQLFSQAVTTVAGQVAPMLPAYVGAFILTASALAVWWYVES